MNRPVRSGFPRVPYIQGCTVGCADAEHAGMICNLSLLGAYVHIDPLPVLRDPVTLSFLLQDGEPPVRAVASVSWVHDTIAGTAPTLPTGFGVRFVELAPAEIRRLAALVAGFPNGVGTRFGLSQPYSGQIRIPFVAPCVLAADQLLARGSVCNLSAGGVYFAADSCPEVGRTAIVAFRLPGERELFERAVAVAWRNPEGPRRVRVLPPGCGLHFLNLSGEDTGRLDHLVESYVGSVARAPA